MPRLPASEHSERRPSQKWIWLSLLGLILLCAAAFHRRQMPFQKSKDLSGYKYVYLIPSDENIEQLRDVDDDTDDEDYDQEEQYEQLLVDNKDASASHQARLDMRRKSSRIYATVQKIQFQEWEH